MASTSNADCSSANTAASTVSTSAEFETAVSQECRSYSRACGAHPDDVSKAKARAVQPVGPPVVLLPGQSAGKKDPQGDFPIADEPASSSSGPAVPGLPVTEGEFPIQQTPLPEPTQEPPVPDDDGDSDDTDATVDYREDSLLALAVGDHDVLIRLPSDFQG